MSQNETMRERKSIFPNPDLAGDDGLVAVGCDLNPATLLDAYLHGIFPWPQEGLPTLWFSPQERGIVDLKTDLKIPRSFKKTLNEYRRAGQIRGVEIRIESDRDFRAVIEACRKKPRPGQDGTWILPEMVEAYVRLFELGVAHSIEVRAADRLIAGLYGVFLNGVFSGESMFHEEPDASKLALHVLLNYLKSKGLEFIDIQMVTPVLSQFGGQLIDRSEYLRRLAKAQKSWEAKKCQFEWRKGLWSHSVID